MTEKTYAPHQQRVIGLPYSEWINDLMAAAE